MNQLIIIDNNRNNYIVGNPKQFKKHLIDFHTSNGRADNSLHEENGRYFTVTPKLIEKVNKFINNSRIKKF